MPLPSVVGAAVCKDKQDEIDSRTAKANLVCIPQAGMGAWAFHGWQKHFSPDFEVLPVEIAGRNSRMMEPKPERMTDCVAGIVDGLISYGAFEKPYILLGHSLGAWVAFEVLAELLRRNVSAPLLLVVSGMRAPHLYDPAEHDADRTSPTIGNLPDDAFWAHFERRYGRNPDLEGPMKDFVLPLLKADFKILETFEPSRGRDEPLPCPIVACAADGDGRLKPGQLSEWRTYAPDEASFHEQTFDVVPLRWSTPHRYLLEDPGAFRRYVLTHCNSALAKLSQGTNVSAKTAAVDVSEGLKAVGLESGEPTHPGGLDMLAILTEAGCPGHADLFRGSTLHECVAKLEASRPAFLKWLAELGVSKLSERQGIANKLGKAKREGRL